MYLLTTLALMLTGVLSLNLANTLPATLQRRDEWQAANSTISCLFMTNDVDWQGEGLNLCQIAGQCGIALPDGLTVNVSSAGPIEGQVCFLHTKADCGGSRSAPIMYPGYADLSEIGFAKQAESWMCYKLCGYFGTSSDLAASAISNEPSQGEVSISTTLSAAALVSSSLISTPVSITETLATLGVSSSGASSIVSISSAATVLDSSSSVAATPVSSGLSSTAVSITETLATLGALSSNALLSVSGSTTTPGPTPRSSLTTALPISSSTTDATTPGFSMSESPLVLTHTFADGSTTILTTGIIEPVPTIPAA